MIDDILLLLLELLSFRNRTVESIDRVNVVNGTDSSIVVGTQVSGAVDQRRALPARLRDVPGTIGQGIVVGNLADSGPVVDVTVVVLVLLLLCVLLLLLLAVVVSLLLGMPIDGLCLRMMLAMVMLMLLLLHVVIVVRRAIASFVTSGATPTNATCLLGVVVVTVVVVIVVHHCRVRIGSGVVVVGVVELLILDNASRRSLRALQHGLAHYVAPVAATIAIVMVMVGLLLLRRRTLLLIGLRLPVVVVGRLLVCLL